MTGGCSSCWSLGFCPCFLLFLPIPGTGLDIKGLSDLLGSDSDILVEGLALLATSALLLRASMPISALKRRTAARIARDA